MKKNICPICGYSKLEFVPKSSYEICPCCGYEFGTFDYYVAGSNLYFDLTKEGYEVEDEKLFYFIREIWLQNGSKWYTEEMKPQNWNLEKQLKNLSKIKS